MKHCKWRADPSTFRTVSRLRPAVCSDGWAHLLWLRMMFPISSEYLMSDLRIKAIHHVF